MKLFYKKSKFFFIFSNTFVQKFHKRQILQCEYPKKHNIDEGKSKTSSVT